MGPEGLLPSLLVFGTMPTFPIIDSDQPAQTERMVATKLARYGMSKLTAELIILEALQSLLPPSTRYELSPSDKVSVFR